jgi:hypothetical protein
MKPVSDSKVDARSVPATVTRPPAKLPNLNTPTVYGSKLAVFGALVKHLGLLPALQAAERALSKAGADTSAVTDSPALYALWRLASTRVTQYASASYLGDERRKSRANSRQSAEAELDDPFEPYCERVETNARLIAALPPVHSACPVVVEAKELKDSKLATAVDEWLRRFETQTVVTW